MKIAVLSDTRLPTLPDGGHGLGMSAHDIATGLIDRGHEVTLYCGVGSAFDGGAMVEHDDEIMRAQAMPHIYDAYLDTSHYHQLSKIAPRLPVVNRICDNECKWAPPNVVVNSPYMQGVYGGRLVNTGIKVDDFKFHPTGKYPVFMSHKVIHKGWPLVREIFGIVVANGEVGNEKNRTLGNASVLIHPSTLDAAPRLPLEAAACGVPTICLSGNGAEYHVEDGKTGFVVDEFSEIQDRIKDVGNLSRLGIREWVRANHGYNQMISGYENLLVMAAAGDRW